MNVTVLPELRVIIISVDFRLFRVNFVNVNDAPVLYVDGGNSASVAYDEGVGPAKFPGDITVSDSDNRNMTGSEHFYCVRLH